MKNPKILIVDDEPYNVDYLEQELETFHYETISASNGQEALAKVRTSTPDLVLLDIMMPIMDGFQVLSYMKADPHTRDIPVVVISADNNLNSVVRGIELGADDYLPKPFEPTLLYARISSSLEKKRLRDIQQLYLQSLERELEIGREIQQGFLPSELPSVNGWEIAVYFKAAREVAGDFYDAFLLPDGNLVFVVGDVCGKGVGAALFMTLFRSLIRATSTTDYFCGEEGTQTLNYAERLEHGVTFTNSYVAQTHSDANMFTTVFIGIIDLQEGNLTYINAGNEPPFLLRGGSITKLPPTSPIVGVIPDATFRAKEIKMEKDDLLLAFTDGVPDALNAEGASFGKAHMQELMLEAGATPALLLEDIKSQLHRFIGEADPFDDITVLAVRKES